MRFFEILSEQEPAQKVATDAPVTATKEQPPADSAPPAQPQTTQMPKKYANNAAIKAANTFLEKELAQGSFKLERVGGTKQVPSIRARGISVADLKAVMAKFGATEISPDLKQSSASSSFPVYSFEKDGILYTAVIGMKGMQSDDETKVGIARKELTPTGLGINGGMFKKTELISAAKSAIKKKFETRDPLLAETLNDLLDSAAAGGNTPLSPEKAKHISPYLGTLSQDFGEILAPILIMGEDDKAELPTGNNPLVDVKLPGMNISVKALTGSGTSFRAISDLMDKYEESIAEDPEAKEKFNILKQFHPSTGGLNTDKIIRASAAANTPEYKSLIKILGVNEIKSYDDLVNAVTAKTGQADYTTFLKTFYPMMTAGPWGKPVGLPADGMYYLGKSDKLKKEKSAGFPSYRINPGKGGADIITYSLGVGLLNDIRQGDNSEKYKTMMTDIVNKADAVIGHITVNPNGTMKLNTKPFSALQFAFQYHAPSHLPGNNLPGFVAILD